MGIPYCIVKGKSRLGRLVNRKTCACVSLNSVSFYLKHIFSPISLFIFSMMTSFLPLYELTLIIKTCTTIWDSKNNKQGDWMGFWNYVFLIVPIYLHYLILGWEWWPKSIYKTFGSRQDQLQWATRRAPPSLGWWYFGFQECCTSCQDWASQDPWSQSEGWSLGHTTSHSAPERLLIVPSCFLLTSTDYYVTSSFIIGK